MVVKLQVEDQLGDECSNLQGDDGVLDMSYKSGGVEKEFEQ